MPPSALTPEQEALRAELEERVREIQSVLRDRRVYDAVDLIPAMADIAHQLHMELVRSNHEPRYTQPLLAARSYRPDDVRFYHNVHPAEYLLKFIDAPDTPQGPPELFTITRDKVA